MTYESYTRTSNDYDMTRRPIGTAILLGCFATSGRPLSELVVLDAGCGTASYALEIVKHVKHVDGVDATEAMIEQGRKKALIAQIFEERLAFFNSDIGQLPFEDDRFDCVMVNQVLHHLDDDPSAGFPQHRAVLGELGRVTRPGGTLVINLCSHEQVLHGFWYRELFANAFQRLRARLIPIPRLVQLLRENGFAHCGNVVPTDALFQGKAYFEPDGPLRESWRNGDSVFALATTDELEWGCAQIQAMTEDGSLARFVQQKDSRRHSLGQVTFVHARLNDAHGGRHHGCESTFAT